MPKYRSFKCKMDLHEIRHTGKSYSWKDSIGRQVYFSNPLLSGALRIEDYQYNNKKPKLIVSYNNKILEPIQPQSIISGSLWGIMKDFLDYWKYEVGQELHNDRHDFVILDRKVIGKINFYLIKCLRCGLKPGMSFYTVKGNQYKEEYWAPEPKLEQHYCPCCGPVPKIVVKGINDISTTDSWMMQYIKDENEAYSHTSFSEKETIMCCPDCQCEKIMTFHMLKHIGYLPCHCKDCTSMPNRIAHNTILCVKSYIDFYDYEYSPEWAGRYSYDNYIEIGINKYIIEMDGELGHGNKTYREKVADSEGLKRDKIKEKLAEEHNIKVIRINCFYGNPEDILDKLIFVLCNLLNIDISFFDKQEILSKSFSSLIKKVCLYYMDHKDVQFSHISKEFHISSTTLTSYLKIGAKYGWCDYITNHKLKAQRFQEAVQIKSNNKDISTRELANILGISQSVVHKYLQEAENKGLLEYTKHNENKKRYKGIKAAAKATSKAIYVYDQDKNLLNTYINARELSIKSNEDFGISFSQSAIGHICRNNTEQYKGYIISYRDYTLN